MENKEQFNLLLEFVVDKYGSLDAYKQHEKDPFLIGLRFFCERYGLPPEKCVESGDSEENEKAQREKNEYLVHLKKCLDTLRNPLSGHITLPGVLSI